MQCHRILEHKCSCGVSVFGWRRQCDRRWHAAADRLNGHSLCATDKSAWCSDFFFQYKSDLSSSVVLVRLQKSHKRCNSVWLDTLNRSINMPAMRGRQTSPLWWVPWCWNILLKVVWWHTKAQTRLSTYWFNKMPWNHRGRMAESFYGQKITWSKKKEKKKRQLALSATVTDSRIKPYIKQYMDWNHREWSEL